MKNIKLIIIAFIITLLIGTTKSDVLEVDDNFLNYFPNMQENYTQTRFFHDNELGGLIFWFGYDKLSTGINISLEGKEEIKTCHKYVKGIYYNPLRGNRLWPLDTGSLHKLQTMDNSYSGLKLEGGLYFDCENYFEENVLGQIKHTYQSEEYFITAGLKIDGNSYTKQRAPNISYDSNGKYIGYLRDSLGGVLVSTNGEDIYFDEVDNFFFPTINDADLEKLYRSDPVFVEGLGDGIKVIATLGDSPRGILFINGYPAGKSGFVKNGDTLEIELISSDEYDSIVSSELKIGFKTANFYISTKKSDEDTIYQLSPYDKLKILNSYKILIEPYKNNYVKLEKFLYTFSDMLDTRIKLEKNPERRAILNYFHDVIEGQLVEVINYDHYDYQAPNCKVYEIKYDKDRQAYYSPDFQVLHYFISKEKIHNFIDSHNLGDGLCGGTDFGIEHVAPNGKVYKIKQTKKGYTSIDFIYTKYFDTIGTIKKYIDLNNPKLKSWDHEVIEDSEVVKHTAPNGKEYDIYETDEGFMSYKFINPQYFETLEEIKEFIDKNNS